MADKLGKLTQQLTVFLKPKLDTLVYYGKVELIPPKPSEIGEIGKRIGQIINRFKSGSWKELTVKDAVLNSLVAMEVTCWFFVGECIGKRKLRGYDVRQ